MSTTVRPVLLVTCVPKYRGVQEQRSQLDAFARSKLELRAFHNAL